eukprot:XP_025000907.1 uncharacterized protein HEATR8L4 [Gallus gallus]
MGQHGSSVAHGGAPGSTNAFLPESQLLDSPRTELETGRESFEETASFLAPPRESGLRCTEPLLTALPAASSTASGVGQLDDKEKKDCEFLWSFLAGEEKELDARKRLLASVLTVCRLRLEGRYLPDGKLEPQHEALVRKKLPSYRCPVMSLGRHAVLAITARRQVPQSPAGPGPLHSRGLTAAGVPQLPASNRPFLSSQQ